MDVAQSYSSYKKIKLFLVFFSLLVVFSCENKTELPLEVEVNYDGNDALNVTFLTDKATKDIKLFLQGMNEPLLGDFEKANNEILFRPIVPFDKGKTYEIRYKEKTIGAFSIRALTNLKKPTITAIYPSKDTVPENLLKMYLVFSKPMQEVKNALDFIEVYNITDNIATSIFLELQNELWNEDHTELTLWLDPGRIKTDLIPNRNQGLPLEAGKEYKIIISAQWTDAENNMLDKEYIKHIYVDKKDRKKPSLEQWKIEVPISGTNDPLILRVNESLDAMLALETMLIYDGNQKIVKGDISLAKNETELLFTPAESWKSDTYSIGVESILEDLAGNNLNHLFDIDLSDTKTVQNNPTERQELSFKIL